MAKKQTYGKPMTKTDMLSALAEATDLTKKEVGTVIDALGDLIGQELGKKEIGRAHV